jgi:hypothetical protein
MQTENRFVSVARTANDRSKAVLKEVEQQVWSTLLQSARLGKSATAKWAQSSERWVQTSEQLLDKAEQAAKRHLEGLGPSQPAGAEASTFNKAD